MPGMLADFLSFLEEPDCNRPSEIQEKYIRDYLDYLAIRPNLKWGGSLSQNYMRKYLQVIRKFARYLARAGRKALRPLFR